MPKLTPEGFETLVQSIADALTSSGWNIEEERAIDYGVSLKLGRGGTVNLYNGKAGPKAVITGKLLEHEQREIEAIVAARVETPKKEETQNAHAAKSCSLLGLKGPWIGSDEAGKGDFFGPLVVSACVMTPELAEQAAKQGVRDSKSMTQREVFDAANWIEANCQTRSIVLLPEAYNTRYPEYGNLNTMLGAMHAKVILALHEATKVRDCLTDRFAKDNVITTHFVSVNAPIKFTSMTKAERDTGVAAASIIARTKFVEAVKELSHQATMELPLGAGAPVKKAAKEMLRLFGPDELQKYVKMHFKTAADIGARPYTAKELANR
ncbi:MAG: ribonuclease HIII [Planctomycetes bacterium]|nr:ribonuclease HIII [Planctomycetota bacterium]